jgi:hypothetical protein
VNLVAARYRSISVASVPVPLDEASLRAHFLGRPAYRRTRYIVVRAAGTAAADPGLTALVEVTRRSDVPLFSEITGIALIAGPDETVFVDAPAADTGIPTSLSEIAADRAPGARCVVVRGRYGHVGFIVDPAPVRVTVVEVVPPHPAKLVDQARRVLGMAEDLPPVELVPELTDLRALAGSHPAGNHAAGNHPAAPGGLPRRCPPRARAELSGTETSQRFVNTKRTHVTTKGDSRFGKDAASPAGITPPASPRGPYPRLAAVLLPARRISRKFVTAPSVLEPSTPPTR